MIEVKTYYDDNLDRIIIEYKNNLLKRHLDLFKKMVFNAGFPGGTTIEEISDNRSNLIIPYSAPKEDRIVNEQRTRIDEKLAKKIQTTLESFAKEAMNLETRQFEIIPLEGYPVENIKTDVQEAVKEKRNFCVIDHMNSYTNFTRGGWTMTQATFDYLSDEYCNIAVAANKGDLDEIYQIVKNKLKKTDWM